MKNFQQKKKSIYLAVITLILFGGCAIKKNTPETNLTVTPLGNILTEKPQSILEVYPTIIPLPPDNILIFRKFEISDNNLLDISKELGGLVVWGEEIAILHFDPHIYLETISNVPPEFGCLSTSPDGNWFTYCQMSSDSPTGQWLIVQSADQREIHKVPMDMNLIYFDMYLWLDNQHLIFPLIETERRPQAYSMVIMNPFVGETYRLDSNYPNLHLSLSGSRMGFSYSDVVYEPSLNLVIFPSWIDDSFIVLWDRQSSSLLAKVKGDIGKYPLWSPDANYFVVPLSVSINVENMSEEWFIITRDGKTEQLTHFGDYFTSSVIGASSWSPDGKKLAFWLDVSPSLCEGLNLAILDVVTRLVTNTCISGRADYAPPPLWSLDNKHVIVFNANTNTRQTILVNVDQSNFFDITAIIDNSRPIGWLAFP